MTMTAFVVLAISTGGLVAGWYFRERTRRLVKFHEAANEFYRRVRPLIEDPDTDDTALRTIQFLNDKINRKASAREFVFAIASRNDEPEASVNGRKQRMLKMQRFFESRPELSEAFSRALSAGLLAVTYNSWLFGWVARMQVMRMVKRHNEAAFTIVRDIARCDIDNIDHNGAVAA